MRKQRNQYISSLDALVAVLKPLSNTVNSSEEPPAIMAIEEAIRLAE